MGSLGILEAAGPGSGAFWKWQFRIDDLVGSGKTEATLSLFAVRRIQLKIVASWRNGAPG
jgi:hypothetical protein